MQNGFVGFNILTVGLAPQTNNSEDITATQRVQDFYHGWYLHPFIFGDYSETMKKIVRLRLPSFTKKKSNLFMMEHLLRRYKAVGIRLDSGDLAYLSCQARKIFCCIEKEFAVSGFGKTSITASNDLNEETLDALNKQGTGSG